MPPESQQFIIPLLGCCVNSSLDFIERLKEIGSQIGVVPLSERLRLELVAHSVFFSVVVWIRHIRGLNMNLKTLLTLNSAKVKGIYWKTATNLALSWLQALVKCKSNLHSLAANITRSKGFCRKVRHLRGVSWNMKILY